MKILLHICCACCAIYPVKELRKRGMEVFGFFFNPNIHPYQEYKRRLDTTKDFSNQTGLELICRDEYRLEEFLQNVVFRERERCTYCYYTRMKSTAQVAKKGKFDFFSTTLLYSKFQKHELIKEIGIGLAGESGVKFLYEDFRKGWKDGIETSKDLGLYRQQYCGCIYSEKERYLKRDV
ncbi:MAG: epoxyqueuosine reductase QueH [Thermodesulfobacteriota bacterium]|nr:epoxyqueuosine reductase QueH [Thermodesulfobacteriota bacterium]